MIDHRASPGIPADIALKMGLDPKTVAEGKLFESATLSCKHCGGAWQKNLHRIRPREYCKECDHYICDDCGWKKAQPGYVHRSKEEILDNVLASGQRGEVFDLSTPKAPTIIIP